jgi:hypothetical protein
MLNRFWQRWWWALALLAIWITFECWISWSAFCNLAKQYGSTYQAAEQNNCVFRGPLFSSVRSFYNWWQHIFDKPDAYVALFTAVLAISTIYLWAVAKKTADAAKRAVELSDITAERQLRAYVTVIAGGMTLINLIEGGIGVRVHVSLKNSGQTPGYKFTTWIKPPQVLDDNADPFTEPTPIDKRTGSSIIGPGAEVHLNQIIKIDQPTAGLLASGAKRVFVWGGADFVDAFGKKRYFIFRDRSGTGIFDTVGHQLALAPHKKGYDGD